MEPNNNSQPMSATKGTGLDTNVASALCYFLGVVTGVLFLVLEKDNKTVRFHAWQSIVFSVAVLLAHVVLTIIPVIGWILLPLLSLGVFVLWLLLMWKAYNKQEWELPVIGKFAREQANKM